MALDAVATITGTLLLPDDTPDRGAVSFRTIVSAADDTPDQRIVTAAPVVIALDDAGAFTVDLVASLDPGWRLDDATVAAGGMPYCVTLNTQGQRGTYTAYLPEGITDLNDLVQLDAPPDVAYVPGPKGPQGAPGYSPVVTVADTTTGDPGTDATVTDTDPGPDVALSFVIPRGEPGQDGEVTTRVTHPNTDDVHAEQWDDTLGRWQTTHYDSGWRDVSAYLLNGWTGVLHVRRVNNWVTWRTKYAGINGEAATTKTFLNPSAPELLPFRRDAAFGAEARTAWYRLGGGVISSGYWYQTTWEMPAYGTSNDRFTLFENWSHSTPQPIPTSLPGTLVSPAPN